jgi:hypothetical protein
LHDAAHDVLDQSARRPGQRRQYTYFSTTTTIPRSINRTSNPVLSSSLTPREPTKICTRLLAPASRPQTFTGISRYNGRCGF